MALLGNLIKKGIELNQRLLGEEAEPIAQQKEQLIELLDGSRDTAFGKYYGFGEILKSDDPVRLFKEEVPFHEYRDFHERWWKQQQKFEGITWPGKPEFFALSSGTTGKTSKRIPITSDFLQSMREVGTSMIRSLPNYDLDESLFESEILMLSSSANLSKNEKGHLEGEISGINVSNFPDWYELFYRPGKEIAAIDDWDKRVEAIAKEAPNWNIGAIAGIPSWVLLMIRKVIEVNHLKTIHDIWPNLSVYASGGVAFEPYRKAFEEVCERPLVIMDTYLASEGFFAYTAHPDSLSMRLALNHGYYFEFIPFDERGVDDQGQLLEDPKCFSIGEVELDQDYVLVVSSCAGAWRYIIGDTIKFTSLDPPEILITGRTKFFLNVVGSQLSEEKLDESILDLSEHFGIKISEYSVAAVKREDGEYIHQWIVVVDGDTANSGDLTKKLDSLLQGANNNYQVARNKALKGIHLRTISKQKYLDYLNSQKKKGGQIKTPKVMKEEKMRDYLDFLDA